MPPAPQVSVIIPHLNEASHLRQCLTALDAQRAEGIPFEIIVVDNGSTELPSAVCSAITGVRLEREAVPGPGPARNRGASVARSELLAFIDADCVAQPGWIRAIVKFMGEKPNVDLLGGNIGIQLWDPDRPTSIEAYESIFGYRAQLYVERHGFAATGNMAVRTDVFRAVGPFRGISAMEDTEWGQRATGQGYRLAYLHESKVLTPSCKSFAELAVRWDRHVAHEFGKVGRHPAAVLMWLGGAAIIAASPLAGLFTILRSNRVSGLRSRLLAFACLTRIRFYRARRMIGLAFSDDTTATIGSWNRKKS